MNLKTEIYKLWIKLKQGLIQVLSASVLNKVITMMCNMVITRILTSSQFGSWSYILNIYSYLSIVSGLGLINAVFQFGAENAGSKKEFSYYKYCLNKGLLINVVLVILGIIFVNFTELPLEGLKIYLVAYIPLLLIEYVVNLLFTILRCQDRIKEYAKYLNINTLLVAFGICIGAFWGIHGVIVGKYVAFILTSIILMSIMKNEINNVLRGGMIDSREIKPLWHFSIIACISSAMNSLLYLIDVSMVTSLLGSAELTGVYKVATIAPNALSFIPSSFIVVILPVIIKNNNNNRWLRKSVRKYYLIMGAANGGIACVMVIMAPLIIKILSGEQYLAAVTPFRILMIGYAISSTFRTLSANILFGLRKVGINMVTSIISGIADFVLNIYLISKYGMIGAAVATVSAEIIASFIAFGYTVYYIYIVKGHR